MGNYEQLKQSVSDVIKTNGNQEITGSILQHVLLTIISTVGANATFAGVATPSTNPGTPDGPVFYLASESGTYTNFNAIELQDGLSVLMWNGSWSSQKILSVDDEPTAGSDNLVKSGGVQDSLLATRRELQEELNQAVESITPIEITGDVINAPDEEDLTSVNVDGTDVLKFKDKAYAPMVYSGLGRKYLRKNIVDGVNILTQSMINQPSTIYVIQYDFTITGNVTIPSNCILEFDGGSISANGSDNTITGTSTGINAVLTKIFNTDVTLAGTWNVEEFYPEWFGAKGDGVNDDTDSIQKVTNVCISLLSNICLSGRYLISKTITIDKPINNNNEGDCTFLKYIGKNEAAIVVNTELTCFGTNLSLSNFILFENIKFVSTDASLRAYVFDRKLIRLSFINCDFYKIKCLCAENYTQTIYFEGCNIRKWNDIWLELKKGCYDVKFHQCIFENDGYGTAIKAYGEIGVHMISQLVIDSCLLEGLQYGIVYANTMAMSVCNSYFEGNADGDIVGPNADVDEFNYGVSITNNIFYSGNRKHDNTGGNGIWCCIWAKTINGVAFGNTFGNNLGAHYIGATANQACFINIFGERGSRLVCNDKKLLQQVYIGTKTITTRKKNQADSICDIILNQDQLDENGNVDKDTSIGWIRLGDNKFRELGLTNNSAKFINYYGSGVLRVKIGSNYSGLLAAATGDGLSEYVLYYVYNNVVIRLTEANRVRDVNFYYKDNSLIVVAKSGTLNLLLPTYVKGTVVDSSEISGLTPIHIIVPGVLSGDTLGRPTLGTKDRVEYFDNSLGKTIWWNGANWVDATGVVAGTLTSGTFANKPTVATNNIPIGFKYFCTDKQTAEGATDGIEIIHKGNDIWVDALGRVVS